MKWDDETEKALAEAAQKVAGRAAQFADKLDTDIDATDFKHKAEGLQFLGGVISVIAHGNQGGNRNEDNKNAIVYPEGQGKGRAGFQ